MVVLTIISGLQLLAMVFLLVFMVRTRSQVENATLDLREYLQEYLHNKEAQIVDFLHNLFQPAGDKPSQFAEMTDSIAQVFANRLVTSFNAAIRGSAGGAAKAEGDALVAANPLLGLLGRGKLGKNPLALAALSFLGQKFAPMGGPAAPVGADHGNGQSPKFHL